MSKRTCETPGCDAPLKARGLCNMHYKQQRKLGLPDAHEVINGLRRSDWEKIDQQDGGCWIWTGCVGATEGYGRVGWQGRSYDAHRYVWLQLRGPIADGLELDHLCRVRACVNPEHLEPVTHKVNVLRGTAPSRQNADRVRCSKGHEFDTVVRRSNGKTSRGCRRCIAAASARYASKKAA